MFKYQSEKELRKHIIKNFNLFFAFSFIDEEFQLHTRGPHESGQFPAIDILGEDDSCVYIIELKKRKIVGGNVKQIQEYINMYKEHSKENHKKVIGILAAPEYNKTAYDNTKDNPDIVIHLLEDVILDKYPVKQKSKDTVYNQVILNRFASLKETPEA